VRAPKVIEIAAVVESRAIPIARLIIGSIRDDRPPRWQQRQNATRLLEQLLTFTYPGTSRSWARSHRASGAPYLERGDDPDPHLQVSVSHAGKWAAAAISTEAGVGADIEKVKPGRDTAELAKFMGWKLRDNAAADFYRRWTLWEAYTKCREGHLFALGGPEFEGLYASSDRCGDGSSRTWHGLHLQFAPNVHAAVVVRTLRPVVTAARALDVDQAQPWQAQPW
jgi:hypothetical protein